MTEEFPVLEQNTKNEKIQENSFTGIDENIFSWDKLLERFGDEETSLEVVSIFLRDNTERIKQLEVAMDSGDIKQIKFLAHSLRGAGGNIGSQALWDTGSQMEHAAVKGDFDLAKSSYNELRPVFDKLVEFFSRPDWLDQVKRLQTESL